MDNVTIVRRVDLGDLGNGDSEDDDDDGKRDINLNTSD